MRLDPNIYFNLMVYVSETFKIRYFGANVLNENHHFIFFSCFTYNFLMYKNKMFSLQKITIFGSSLKYFSILPYRKQPQNVMKNEPCYLKGTHWYSSLMYILRRPWKWSKHMFCSKVYSNKPCASEVNANLPWN